MRDAKKNGKNNFRFYLESTENVSLSISGVR